MFDLEILDKILLLLSKAETHKIGVLEINVLLREDILLSHYITEFIIKKNIERLLQDNYIKEIKENLNVAGFEMEILTSYSLTTHGYTFIKESGYTRTYYSKLSLEEENRLLRKSQIELNVSTRSTNIRMIWLTVAIAVGSVVSAVYYIIEILAFFHLCKR